MQHNKRLSETVALVNWVQFAALDPATSEGGCFLCSQAGRFGLYINLQALASYDVDIALFQTKEAEITPDPGEFIPIEGAEINLSGANGGVDFGIIDFRDTDLNVDQGYSCIGIMVTNNSGNPLDLISCFLMAADSYGEPIKQTVDVKIVEVGNG